MESKGIIKQRAFRGGEDSGRVRSLLSAHYAVKKHPYFLQDPINWERMRVKIELGISNLIIQLWEIKDELAGMLVYAGTRGEFACLSHPDFVYVEDRMVAWVEKFHADSSQKPLNGIVCGADISLQAVLSQRGYWRVESQTVFRRYALDSTQAKIHFPGGYKVKTVSNLSKGYLKQLAGVQNEVIGWHVTPEFLEGLAASPVYRPELDLAALDEKGSIAAFCSAWFDAPNHAGYIEPLGTALEQRHRGLGGALLNENFRCLQRLGADVVYLGHSVENRPAGHLYESVGMHVFDRDYIWERSNELSRIDA